MVVWPTDFWALLLWMLSLLSILQIEKNRIENEEKKLDER